MLNLSQINTHCTHFLDRDGVINEEKQDSYIFHYGEFSFYDQAKDALRILAETFGRIVVVTNQRGVGKGMMTAADLADIHEKMVGAIVLARRPDRPDLLCRLARMTIIPFANQTREWRWRPRPTSPRSIFSSPS